MSQSGEICHMSRKSNYRPSSSVNCAKATVLKNVALSHNYREEEEEEDEEEEEEEEEEGQSRVCVPTS